jgi:nicotinamidase-related amidase
MIDMQRFFFEENPALCRTGLRENCVILLNALRRGGVPVIHVHTIYKPDRSDWPSAWRQSPPGTWCERLVEGAASAEVVSGLEPERGEVVVRKRRFSGFYETTLQSALQSLGARSVMLAGYSADVCVRFTAVDAYNRGYDVTVVQDCVEAFKERTADSTEYIRWLTNCSIVSFDRVKKQLTTIGADE